MYTQVICEICGSTTRAEFLRGGGALDRCVECGHLQRDLERAPAWHRDVAYGGDPTLDRARLALTYRELARRAPGQPGRVFEVGFGTGALLLRFAHQGSQVAGCDSEQLQASTDPRLAEQATLWHVPIEAIDTSETYDLVYGVHVVEHVTDPLRTAQVCRELLRPGGQVQFLTPAGDGTGPTAYGAAWWMLEDPTHVRFFSAVSLTRMLEQAGFIDVQVRRLVLDSLATDGASLTRMVRKRAEPAGVLSSAAVLGGAALSAPFVLVMRALVPRTRTTLHVTARRPT
ncbi:class I SAM-dependent methyltransferase [Demetria terragena]|uniref:class I SAM-dependent methyltransferase n=1 Tax=Demetria terragena TaxID=63959 RepID=UPI00037B7D81|nr:class I SAM-dependent methyltransferase [Demetria terragena]